MEWKNMTSSNQNLESKCYLQAFIAQICQLHRSQWNQVTLFKNHTLRSYESVTLFPEKHE